LDIQNVASHELGHAVGLGHVNDNLLTMFPTSFAGETLKRSLGNGEQAGMNFLYPGSNTWASSWTSLGGGIKADTSPAVARNSDGRLQVFIVGTNNQLYYKTQTAAAGSSWYEWSPLGGGAAPSSNPQVAMNQNGGLVAFIIGSNNNGLFYKEQTTPGGSSWSEWSPLGGGAALSSNPQVAMNQNGGLVAFIIGSNNNGLFYKLQIIF
jgi:hypothetical protein